MAKRIPEVYGHVLGLLRVSLTEVTPRQAKTFIAGLIVLNIGALFALAVPFQMFWAWFVPGVAPALPHHISYGHAVATLLVLLSFMPKSNRKP